ncbi:hypothetical protein [Streptomyces sp. YIM S03343]
MHTPPHATHRRTRSGGTHLTLVTNEADAASDDDNEQQSGKHAAPPRPLMVAGSATVRALMALGALLAALGVSIGRADAVLSRDQPLEEAEPPEQPTPRVALTGTGANTAGMAGYWAPATKPVVAASYRVHTPAPTGRHRNSSAAEGSGERKPDTGEKPTGRHRKPHTHTSKHHSPHTPTAVEGWAARNPDTRPRTTGKHHQTGTSAVAWDPSQARAAHGI